MNVRLYFWQRLSAAVMAPLLIVHLALILFAGAKGLSAADVLARTRGSLLWALFYGTFVAAAAIHASIGLRNVLIEWTNWAQKARDVASLAFGLALAGLGARAVVAVILP